MTRIKVEITHADKVLLPATASPRVILSITGPEVADVMLRHLQGRPLTLQRFPAGIDEEPLHVSDLW